MKNILKLLLALIVSCAIATSLFAAKLYHPVTGCFFAYTELERKALINNAIKTLKILIIFPPRNFNTLPVN